jgi:hypothetical protein
MRRKQRKLRYESKQSLTHAINIPFPFPADDILLVGEVVVLVGVVLTAGRGSRLLSLLLAGDASNDSDDSLLEAEDVD